MSDTCRFCGSEMKIVQDDYKETKNGNDLWQRTYRCQTGCISKFTYIPQVSYEPIDLDVFDPCDRKIYA